MTTQKNGSNNDGLDIPAALRRTKGETPAKPTAPAKPALSAKAEAQQRAGVKVTDKVKPTKPAKAPKATKPAAAPKAPATPANATAAADPVVKADAKDKPVVTAKQVAVLVKAIRAHATHFAYKNGWDFIVKWSDAEITKAIDGLSSKSAAIKHMRKIAQGLNAKRPKDQPAPARA
jgi:hypothetical protein